MTTHPARTCEPTHGLNGRMCSNCASPPFSSFLPPSFFTNSPAPSTLFFPSSSSSSSPWRSVWGSVQLRVGVAYPLLIVVKPSTFSHTPTVHTHTQASVSVSPLHSLRFSPSVRPVRPVRTAVSWLPLPLFWTFG